MNEKVNEENWNKRSQRRWNMKEQMLFIFFSRRLFHYNRSQNICTDWFRSNSNWKIIEAYEWKEILLCLFSSYHFPFCWRCLLSWYNKFCLSHIYLPLYQSICIISKWHSKPFISFKMNAWRKVYEVYEISYLQLPLHFLD